MPSLADLLEQSHKKLRQLFVMQQECLLLAEDHWAVLLMSAFADYLRAHLLFENEKVFTLFVGREAGALRWQVLVYQKEHEKLLQLVNKNQQFLLSYVQLKGREKRLALLELLAMQNQLEHVLEHHEQREESDMFQVLSAQNTEHLEHLAEQWQAKEQQCLSPYQTDIKVIAQALAS